MYNRGRGESHMAEKLSLENKVALVTGGSRGIGRAVALELAARGAAVVVNYNKSSGAADEVVKKIQEAGGRAAAFQADVSDFKQADAFPPPAPPPPPPPRTPPPTAPLTPP